MSHPTAQILALFTAGAGISQFLLAFLSPHFFSRQMVGLPISTSTKSPVKAGSIDPAISYMRMYSGRTLGLTVSIIGCYYLQSETGMGMLMLGCATGAAVDSFVVWANGGDGKVWGHLAGVVIIGGLGVVLLS